MELGLADYFRKCSKDELSEIVEKLMERMEILNDRMIDKVEVADRAGMSVSWLDNSDCEKAIKLRDLGVRYGKSRTSPIRFPLSDVVRVCRIDERFS